MRNKHSGASLSIRAIAGNHVVALAWDLKRDQFDTTHLLGFAVERTEFATPARQNVVEGYFLRGIKRFEEKEKGPPAGTPVPISEHPIQSFQWGDYTAKPATTYRYRVVPVYGAPKLIELDDASATTVEITTEAEEGGVEDEVQSRHDIYFNRG